MTFWQQFYTQRDKELISILNVLVFFNRHINHTKIFLTEKHWFLQMMHARIISLRKKSFLLNVPFRSCNLYNYMHNELKGTSFWNSTYLKQTKVYSILSWLTKLFKRLSFAFTARAELSMYWRYWQILRQNSNFQKVASVMAILNSL